MALAAERAKYGLPVEFKVTREMKKNFTPQEKAMHKTAYEIGGAKRANEVMRIHFANKKRAAAAGAAGEGGASGAGGEAAEQPDSLGRRSASAGATAAAAASRPAAPPRPTLEVTLGENLAPGHLVYAGTVDWDNVNKRDIKKDEDDNREPVEVSLWGFHRIAIDLKIRLVASGPSAVHCLAVDEGGVLYAWGRNDAGQLGVGDTHTRAAPVKVKGLTQHKVRHAACGRRNTLICTEGGEMLAWGTHKAGQLGTGRKVDDGQLVPAKVAHFGPPVVRVAAGAEFCSALDDQGQVYAWGHPMYGQLGDNNNGEFIERAGSTSFHFVTAPQIVKFSGGQHKFVDVVCGNNHTVTLSQEGRIFTWGFGGYGRLGHNSQKDLMVPQELDLFNVHKSNNPRNTAKLIAAGATCSYVLTQAGQTYFWGRTKSSGEATMYPKTVHDLNGWTVHSISCGNNSTIVSADEALITWGPSPTYGELGYGDPETNPKSSTTPKLVDPVQGAKFPMVTGGHGMAVAIMESSEKYAEILEKLPVYQPAELVIVNEKNQAVDDSASKKRSAAGDNPKGKKSKQ